MTWTELEHPIPAIRTITFLCVVVETRHREPISIRIPPEHLRHIPFDCTEQCLCVMFGALSLRPYRIETARWPVNSKCWTIGCLYAASIPECNPIVKTIWSYCSEWISLSMCRLCWVFGQVELHSMKFLTVRGYYNLVLRNSNVLSTMGSLWRKWFGRRFL